jgi:hypothetical protein
MGRLELKCELETASRSHYLIRNLTKVLALEGIG